MIYILAAGQIILILTVWVMLKDITEALMLMNALLNGINLRLKAIDTEATEHHASVIDQHKKDLHEHQQIKTKLTNLRQVAVETNERAAIAVNDVSGVAKGVSLLLDKAYPKIFVKGGDLNGRPKQQPRRAVGTKPSATSRSRS